MTHPDMRLVPVETLLRCAALLENPKAEHQHDVSYLIEEIETLAAAPHQPQPAAREEAPEGAGEFTDEAILKAATEVRESSVAWADNPEEFSHLIELTPDEISRLIATLRAQQPAQDEAAPFLEVIPDRNVEGCYRMVTHPPPSQQPADDKLREAVEAYDVLRSAWTFRQANALHGDKQKYQWACRRFDEAFDAADKALAALKAEGK
ncbi:hypothetical protein [Brevundimonas nasdae]|uniref:hypothetical protein n=1 Tax=Brevundimonas nasdae TaxID=172043 RepID=UPI0028A148AB|nr:hypothetical protein [Brevundimonas nasdae]